MLIRNESSKTSPYVRKRTALVAWQLVAKRAFDLIGSAAALVVLSPLLLVITVLIKATSTGSVLFEWNVVGRGGKPFVGYKFRTMCIHADRMREQLWEKNEMTSVFFKMKDDPR